MTVDALADVRDRHMTRSSGRVVAWSEWGDPNGTPLLRVPGTPGSRFSLRGDRTPWVERQLYAITTERPGFGASTWLPGRRLAEPADDLAAVLDELGIEALHVIGGSGSAPHELAFAARHPQRVKAMTILVGAAPLNDVEIDAMIDINAKAHRLIDSGDIDGLRQLLQPVREAMMADPIAALRDVMDKAPEADRRVMADPLWQAQFAVAAREALSQGIDGWVDESVVMTRDWNDIDLTAVRTSVSWWHGASDANAPMSAAQRLVTRLPNARLIPFGEDDGHLAGYHREGEILDELLARG